MRLRPSKFRASDKTVKISPTGREWLFRLVLLIVPLAILLVAETGLRLAGYGHSPEFWTKTGGPDTYTTNQDYGRRFFPRALVRTPQPRLLSREKPAGVYRIFVLGGSAAMGIPEPAFSFGRILETMLEKRYAGVKFEVVNAAMTAINSHVALPIARDCAEFSPDLFVVYMGNNEVVGPFGPGTVFQRFSPGLVLIRSGIWLNSTKTGQLMVDGIHRMSKTEARFKEWGGMAMFLDKLVAADDPRMEQVYRGFRRNLLDICRAGHAAGAKVALCTVATNIKDCAPFASVHGRELSPANQALWEKEYETGLQMLQAGEYSRATEKFLDAAELDDRYADLHFQLAECYLRQNKTQEARRHAILARDLDALRFRADTLINQTIRDVARSQDGEQAYLVDVEGALERNSGRRDELLGDELLYEHVHLNFDGNYLVARTLFDHIEPLLPEWVTGLTQGVDGPASKEEVATDLALTDWALYRMEANILGAMKRPPFTLQIDHPLKLPAREERLHRLSAESNTPSVIQRARSAYLSAIARDPDDPEYRLRYVELLREAGEPAEATVQLRALLRLMPGIRAWQAALGDTLRDEGKLDEAKNLFQEVLRTDPEYIAAHVGLGTVLHREEEWQQAAGHYERALLINPGSAEAHNNLGLALVRLGQQETAAEHYTTALRINPSYAEAHNNLGLALASLGRLDEAIEHYSEALRLKPTTLAGAHYNLAGALVTVGRAGDGIRHYQQALRINPAFVEAQTGLGAVLATIGRTDESINHFSEALRLRQNLPEVHYNLGVLLARQGRLGQAITHYQRAVELNPDYVEALNNMGSALARQGEIERAVELFTRALEIRPDFADARRNLNTATASSGRVR